MTSTFLTSPLDVVKTRLQSDFYKHQLDARKAQRPADSGLIRQGFRHFQETFQILGYVIYHVAIGGAGNPARHIKKGLDS